LPVSHGYVQMGQSAVPDILNKVIHVLLVEDNPPEARLVREMLIDAGADSFILTHAEQLSEAISSIGQRQFDVILLDLSLPDSHGLDTVARITAAAANVPIVVLSGLDDERLALEAVQNGAQDYLVKGQGDGHLIKRSIRYAIERKRSEDRLIYMARYDQLTGLINRPFFLERLTDALERGGRNDRMVALMFLDLDKFKAVNDTFGHDLGDLLLKATSQRLEQCIRQTDTVARLGGDEFTVILEGISDVQAASTVAQKILDSFTEPFDLDGHCISVAFSIGITVFPSEADNVADLMKYADTAMYRAKELGGNNYQFYFTIAEV